MPFYEYQCKNCGHELEAMQKISEEPLKKCPHCGKSQLQRLMSAPVFRLKGSGWYETDFKDDKDKKRNLADSPEADSSKDKESEPKKTDAVEPKVDTKTVEKEAPAKPKESATSTDAKPSKEAKPKKRPAKATAKKGKAAKKSKAKR